MTPRTPRRVPPRKAAIVAEIERQRSAKVIHRNEPNPVLMDIAAQQIVAANWKRLEAEFALKQSPTQ